MTDTSSPLIDCQEDRITISRLLSVVEGRFTEEQQSHIYHAYMLAAEAHNGQQRKSGEAYIFHPLATAYIVAKFELDCESIIAAILHDVLEDTDISRDELVRQFGEPVTAIVDGLSKLTTIKFDTQAEKQAANFQKMLLAMVDDIRVILIKLADRLHNMQTLGAMKKVKRVRIARETLDIFVPIANRLGIYSIKNQLEDLGFKALHPYRYSAINNAIKNIHGRRKELIQKQEIIFTARFEELGIEAKVRGREKHAYSVYQKMRDKQLSFSKVFDVYAVRVVVNSVDECYRALGVVHSFYSPIPKKFKDYIAVPKNNGYQSLHTLVVNNDGLLMEVQIRTREMDKYAETGIASHWAYKEGEKTHTSDRARQWLSNLIELKEKTTTNVEFLEQVKLDLFPHEIYVFSPKGDIYQLPYNATPVDFAYAVHSEVGEKCGGAIVNKQRVSLSTKLHSGQTVDIITSRDMTPEPHWLSFVVTTKARLAIRHYLKNHDHERAAQFGRRLLNNALGRYRKSIYDLDEEQVHKKLDDLNLSSSDELYANIGLGSYSALVLADSMAEQNNWSVSLGEQADQEHDDVHLLVEGRESSMMTLAKCCKPIPGDNIQGYATPGQGVVVHRVNCKNTRRYARRPNDWVTVGWSEGTDKNFLADIIVVLVNKPGALARVATLLSSMRTNIEHIRFDSQCDTNTIIRFSLSVESRHHLARIIRRLRNFSIVQSVKRKS